MRPRECTSGGQPSEYLDIADVLLSPWPAVAQARELLLHGEHAGDAHGRYRRAIERPGLVAERSRREQPVGPSSQGLTERSVCAPIKVGGAEQNVVPRELAGLRRRLSRQSNGASLHENCLRPLGVNALEPELDVAVLAGDPADPRIEAPASEQPHWDSGCLRDRYDLADDIQLPFGALVHGSILPCRMGFGAPAPRPLRTKWTAHPVRKWLCLPYHCAP
jgi:hypothetical protein